MEITQIVIAVATAVVAFAVAWGARGAKSDASLSGLDKRHAALAEETRKEFVELKQAKYGAERELAATTTAIAVLAERMKTVLGQIDTLERSKASVDALQSVEQYLGRIDGKLDMLMASLLIPKNDK